MPIYANARRIGFAIPRRGLGAANNSIAQMIVNAAAAVGIPSQLAVEVGIKESGLNQSAVSPAGAVGVMQLEPATAAQLGVDATNTAQNIQGGTTYLSQLYAQFGSWDAALAAYDWGPGNVTKAQAAYGANWLSAAPAETQNYVSSILSNAGMADSGTSGAYQPSITPDSLLSGTADAVDNAVQGVDISTLLLLTLGIFGMYFLSDFLVD